MNIKEKTYAEKLLKRIFIGSQLNGLEFGVGPGSIKVFFIHQHPMESQPLTLFLNMESKWTVFADTLELTQEIPIRSEEEMYQWIIDMRRKKVIDVSLGEETPHLLIHFEHGKILYVNGKHDQ
ncbi:hypothetical protein [Sutcliffiella horikoshii]|uniref:hypothetical protein n=1 Tax=Sutcliffiella horikoshii TaxID=79883 RepID=UPI0021CC6693|nr:hypothetical protein [Sutcliffiella horikoshii]